MTPAPQAPVQNPQRPPAQPVTPVYLAFGASRVDGRDLSGTEVAYRISSDPDQAGQAATKNRGLLLVVAEGAGDPATAPLRKVVLDQVIKSFEDIPPDIDRRAMLRTVFENANAALRSYQASNPNLDRAGVVAAAAIVKGEVAHVAHIGACRVYLVSADGAVTALTRDHTMGQQHLERGLKKEAIATMPDANSLTRWLGMADGVVPDLYGPVRLNAGDCLVLTSRGVHGALEDYQVGLDVANRSPAEGVRRLIGHASKATPGLTATALIYGPTAGRRLPVLPLGLAGLVVIGLALIGSVLALVFSAGDNGSATPTPRIALTIVPTSLATAQATLAVVSPLPSATNGTVISGDAPPTTLPTSTPNPTVAPSPTSIPNTRRTAVVRDTATPEPTVTPVVVTTVAPPSPQPADTQSPPPPPPQPPSQPPSPPPDATKPPPPNDA